LLGIADCIVEAMAPRMDAEGWESSPIGKFFLRFGPRWHSIAWYVEDVALLWRHLGEHGLRMVFAGDPEEGPSGYTPLYTHPRDSLVQLEFMRRRERRVVDDWAQPGEIDPRYLPGWSSAWWGEHHPLGIERMAYVGIVCDDAARARAIYVDALGGTLLSQSQSTLTQTTDDYVRVGPSTVVQLSVPTDEPSLARRDLDEHGPAVHVLAFEVRDLETAEKYLVEKGLAILDRDESTIQVDPASCFGAAYRFTAAPPRPDAP
jgi:catechol 2,3-dioxygenase-like lactoylglutathione lyase family enzyme